MSDGGDGPRRARIETSHAAPATVAAALAPDDTDATHTRVVDGAVVATVDDHLVNLRVAERVVATTRARRRETAGGGTERSTDADVDADATTDTETEDT